MAAPNGPAMMKPSPPSRSLPRIGLTNPFRTPPCPTCTAIGCAIPSTPSCSRSCSARLETVRPAPARALLRRVYLDLTGLPPTLAEQDAFLKDPRRLAPLVDELLARPAYGERWARHWLDLVRFAETNGYERDATKPNAWRYRDYVIRAFNARQALRPLRPRATRRRRAARRRRPRPSSRPAITASAPGTTSRPTPKQDRFDQLDDIVSTTSQVFLGLTLGCARCHDHKFEPLTARDYYRMVAVFNALERPRNGRTELDLPAGTRPEIRPLPATIAATARCAAARESRPAIREAATHSLRQHIGELAAASGDRRAPPHSAGCRRGYYPGRADAAAAAHAFLLIRGKAATPGPAVAPAVPAVLVHAQPDFPPPRRTSLAPPDAGPLARQPATIR